MVKTFLNKKWAENSNQIDTLYLNSAATASGKSWLGQEVNNQHWVWTEGEMGVMIGEICKKHKLFELTFRQTVSANGKAWNENFQGELSPFAKGKCLVPGCCSTVVIIWEKHNCSMKSYIQTRLMAKVLFIRFATSHQSVLCHHNSMTYCLIFFNLNILTWFMHWINATVQSTSEADSFNYETNVLQKNLQTVTEQFILY